MYQLPPQYVEFVKPEGFIFERTYEGDAKELLLDVFNNAISSFISKKYGFFDGDNWESSVNAFLEVYKLNKTGIIKALKKAFGNLVKSLSAVISRVGTTFQFSYLDKLYTLQKDEALELLSDIKEGKLMARIGKQVIAWGKPIYEEKKLKH